MDIYKADVALVAGDLTGKAIVPILQRRPLRRRAVRVRRNARDDDELAVLKRDIADVGYYSFITTSDEAERLSTDEQDRDELLHRLMNERVDEWMNWPPSASPTRTRRCT